MMNKCECGRIATYWVAPLVFTDLGIIRDTYVMEPPPSARFAACDEHLYKAITYVMGDEFTKVLVRRDW